MRAEPEDGAARDWMLEAGTPNVLLRRGLTRSILTTGTAVVVRGYQSKDQVCNPMCWGSGRDITFPDGTRLFMGSSGTGAPRDGAPDRTVARRGYQSTGVAGWHDPLRRMLE